MSCMDGVAHLQHALYRRAESEVIAVSEESTNEFLP